MSTTRASRVRRRGDNIPPVSAYAHWNEDAYYMWYEENKYDMEHADEILEDEWYEQSDYEPDPYEDWFETEEEARAFALKVDASERDISQWKNKDGVIEWGVEHYNTKEHQKQQRRRK